MIFVSLLIISIIALLFYLYKLYKNEVNKSEKYYQNLKNLENEHIVLKNKYQECLFFKEHGMTENQYNDLLWDNYVKNNQPIL
jgi:hypothetical protein